MQTDISTLTNAGFTLLIAWISELSHLVSDPSSRLYWVYLLSAIAIAFGASLLIKRNNTNLGFSKTLFNCSHWLNQSSALDLALLLTNALLRIAIFIPWLVGSFAVAFWVAKNLTTYIGVNTQSEMPLLVWTIAYTITLLLANDLARYLTHRAMHAYPLLWHFHKIHHSAESMTPLTLYRIHPVEACISHLRDVLIVGAISGLFFYFQGNNSALLTILGVNAGRFIFNFAGANLRHSHFWLSFGSLEKYFISPAQHQLHHSKAEEHHDINFGSQFAIWDRIFGTWQPATKYQELSFGLTDKSKTRQTRYTKGVNLKIQY